MVCLLKSDHLPRWLFEQNGIVPKMIIFKAIFVSFVLFGSVFCVPDSINLNKTCPLDSSKFVQPEITLLSWEQCRDLCNNQTECVAFTFYGQNGSPFKNLCFLLNELCDNRDLGKCFPLLFFKSMTFS